MDNREDFPLICHPSLSVWWPKGAWTQSETTQRLRDFPLPWTCVLSPWFILSFCLYLTHRALSWLQYCWPATSHHINILIVSESVCEKWLRGRATGRHQRSLTRCLSALSVPKWCKCDICQWYILRLVLIWLIMLLSKWRQLGNTCHYLNIAVNKIKV